MSLLFSISMLCSCPHTILVVDKGMSFVFKKPFTERVYLWVKIICELCFGSIYIQICYLHRFMVRAQYFQFNEYFSNTWTLDREFMSRLNWMRQAMRSTCKGQTLRSPPGSGAMRRGPLVATGSESRLSSSEDAQCSAVDEVWSIYYSVALHNPCLWDMSQVCLHLPPPHCHA